MSLKSTLLFPWLGSKTRMRSKILPFFATIRHAIYIEPFGGACGMIWGKPKERWEVYNDINELLCNVFRVIRKRENVDVFKELARYSPPARSIWKEYKNYVLTWVKGDAEEIRKAKEKARLEWVEDDVLCAFAFFYVQRNGFGGQYMHTYGTEKPRAISTRKKSSTPRILTYRKVIQTLDQYCDRLQTVNIENDTYENVFKRYDMEDALFYCDPPYDTRTSDNYNTGWGTDKAVALVDILTEIKGNAVVSCYDSPIYERLLKAGYKRERFKAYMSVCKTSYQQRIETVYYKGVIRNAECKQTHLFTHK